MFGYSSHLKTHVKTVHEGLKEHQCDFCDSAFGQSSHLKNHIKRVHQGLKITSSQQANSEDVPPTILNNM